MSPTALAKDDLDRTIARQEKRLASALKSLLKWSADRRISGFRHRLYALLLKVEPYHRSARRALDYRRTESGEWKQSSMYTPPKDWDLQMVKVGEQKLAEKLTAFRDSVIEEMGEVVGLDPGRRARVVNRLLEFVPNDKVLREERGEVLHRGRWLLPDTIAALETRAAIQLHVSALRTKAAASIAKTDPRGWTAAYDSATRRVVGTVDAEEVRNALLSIEIGEGVAQHLLGSKPPPGKALGPTYLMLVKDRAQALDVARQNGYSREAIGAIQSVSAVILDKGETALLYTAEARHRILAGVRYVIDAHIRQKFGPHRRAWLSEGLGQRLTWHATQDHGIVFASLEGTERKRQEGRGTLPNQPREWLPAAAAVLDAEGAKALARVLTARLNAMTASDVLVSYGLAAYLLEARPDLGLDFIQASVRSTDTDAIAKKHLGAGLPVVAERLRRWLRQQD